MVSAGGAAERATPADAAELAAVVADAARERRPLRIVGGATKAGWGGLPAAGARNLSTAAIRGVRAYRPGDFVVTAGAGTPLAELAATLAAEGQMLALDPPLGADDAATLGGVLATADGGPLRHRYGGPRDVLLGIAAVLGDGALVRSGSAVIKNVAGYDLGRLLCGAFGTLGIVAEATLRVHPLPARRIAVRGRGDGLAAAIGAVNRLPLEADAVDAAWRDGAGELLVGLSGAAPEARARQVAALLERHGLAVETIADPAAERAAWAAQRAAQRAAEGCVVRVAAPVGAAARLLDAVAARPGARLVGRAGIGTWWLTLPAAGDDTLVAEVAALRRELAGCACTVADGPEAVRRAAAWPAPAPTVAALRRRLRAQFDPEGVLNAGVMEDLDG